MSVYLHAPLEYVKQGSNTFNTVELLLTCCKNLVLLQLG